MVAIAGKKTERNKSTEFGVHVVGFHPIVNNLSMEYRHCVCRNLARIIYKPKKVTQLNPTALTASLQFTTMITHLKKSGFLKAVLLAALVACVTNRAQAQAIVMGMSNSFGILSGSSVTASASPGVETGDVGVSPGSAITLGGMVVTGGVFSSVPPATTGHADAQTAYNQMMALPVTPVVGVLSGDLGGKTLAPGVYSYSSSAQLTGVLTLSGQGQYVFQIGSTLTTASGSNINLINGANASNVFFAVGSSATLGTGTTFNGTIISLASGTMTTGSTLNGHFIALTGAETFDANAITTTTNLIVNSTTFDLMANRNEPVSVVTLSNAGQILGTGTSSLINTGNYNFQDGSVTAILSGTGSVLNKTTTGTVTLSGANTYTGGTTISAGTLAVTNLVGSATGTGAVTVVSGATLTGTGSVSNVVVNNGGILTPGSNGVGTMTMTALTLAPSSITNLNFNGTANSKLVVTNTNGLNLGSGAVLDIYQAGTTTAFITPGTYQLIGYVGAVTGTPSSLTVGTSTGGLNFAFSATGSFIDLTIALASGPGSWSATGNGNWSDTTKWTSGVVGAGVGNTAVFGSSITAPSTVTLDGSQTVGGLTFGNANSYTIALGSGALTLNNSGATSVIAVSLGNHTISAPLVLTTGGATAQVSVGTGLTLSGVISQTATAGLTKAGLGTLTLSAVNTYTGDTVVTGGTMTESISNAVPAVSNLTVNGSTADFDLGANHNNTVKIVSLDGNGSITGTGTSTLTSTGGFQVMNGTVTAILAGAGIALTKTTTGIVTLAGANTYTGATTVSAGTLIIAPTGSLAPAGVVNVAAGAVLTVNNNGTVATLNSNGVINGTSTLTAANYNLNDGSQINTSLGAGNVASNGNVGVNATLASNNITIQSGTMTLQQPNLLLNNATVDIVSGANLVLGNGNDTILGLIGNGTLSETNGILTVVNGFGTFNGTVNGAVAANGSLVSNSNLSIGAGTVSSYPNGTTITGGTLAVNGILITPLTTIDTGGTLGGNGTVTGNVVDNGGTVSPGNSPGIITIGGNYTEGGTLKIEIAGTSGPGSPTGNDEVVVGGNTVIIPATSTLQLVKFNPGYEPAKGDTFKFISGAVGSISGHFGTFTSNFTNDIIINMDTGQAIGTGLPAGTSVLNALPGLSSSQRSMINSLQVGDHQYGGGDLLALLLTPANAALSSQILNKASPEAYAGLTDYAVHATQAYRNTALGLTPVAQSGAFSFFMGYSHLDMGSDSSQNQADYNLESDGAIAGARMTLNPMVSLGIFTAADFGSVNSSYLSSTVTGEVSGVFVSVDPLPDHRLNLLGGFTYGNFTNKGTRQTFSGSSSMPSVNSTDYRFDLGAQYLALKQGKFSLTPEVDLSAGQSKVDDFTESNPTDPLQALHVHGQNNTSFVAGVGLNGAYAVTSQIDLTARIGVSDELDHSYRSVTANVANQTGDFTVRAPGLGDTEFNLGVGVNYKVTKLLRLSLSYQAGFSTNEKMSNALFLGASVSF